MKKDCSDIGCHNCAMKSVPFSKLTDEQLEYADKNKTVVTYNIGETICKKGAPLTHVLFLWDGIAKVYTDLPNQKHVIMKLLKKCDMYAGPGIFADEKYHYSVTALTPVKLCMIKIEAFYEIARQNSLFTYELLSLSNHAHIRYMFHLTSLTQKNMQGRFSDMLLYLRHHIYDENPFTANTSRQDMADMTAMSKESLIRIMKEFKEEGLIEVNGDTITLLQEEKIKFISEHS
ncbi:MAG: hypothetical protein C0593_00040 [Marinilabiliales bacterium]|nr:MAG: hypothetical protein C0593_00040 [Marinilabiliales bacterium]